MVVKVCGMREPENVAQLAQLRTDMIGLIFYEKSSRFVEAQGPQVALQAPIFAHSGFLQIPKVGVFVDAPLDYVLEKVGQYGLSYVQLHGKENLFYCQKLRKRGLRLLKAFSIDEKFNFNLTSAYEYLCDYFLFDTKGAQPGGNGVPFNWALLEQYQGTTPFLLSGGIGPESVKALRQFKHPQWAGLDLNSRFEVEPGRKEIWLLHRFIEDLREAQVLMSQLPNWD